MEQTDTPPPPPPGSVEALKQGCECPVLDNNHGEGWMGSGHYWVAASCPIHGTDQEVTRRARGDGEVGGE